MEIQKASDTSGLGTAASELYGRTLAKHHNWVLAKTAGTLLLMMPNKKTIIERVSGHRMVPHTVQYDYSY